MKRDCGKRQRGHLKKAQIGLKLKKNNASDCQNWQLGFGFKVVRDLLFSLIWRVRRGCTVPYFRTRCKTSLCAHPRRPVS